MACESIEAECRGATPGVCVSASTDLPPRIFSRNIGLILAGFVLLLGTLGCRTTNGGIFLQIDDHRNPTLGWTFGHPSTTRTGGPKVKLFAAINETVSFQFSLEAAPSLIAAPRFVVDKLRADAGLMDAGTIQVYRMLPVENDDYPGWHIRNFHPSKRNPNPFDVLVPCDASRSGWPAALVPGERYHFWVDIMIPKAVSPGSYLTTISFYDGDRPVGTLDIEIEVWPFSLPDRGLIPLIADVDHRLLFDHHNSENEPARGSTVGDRPHDTAPDAINELLSYTLQCLRRHRLTPVLPHLTPVTRIGTRRRPEIDWDQYDKVVSPLLDGSLFPNKIPLEVWPLPIPPSHIESGSWQSPGWYALHGEFVKVFLSECATHFEQRGWLSRSYLDLPSLSPENLHSNSLAVGSLVRQADPRIPILVPWFPQDMQPYGWAHYARPPLEAFADIWVPPAQFFDPEIMAHQRSLGRKTWLTVDRPPFSGCAAIHALRACTRVIAQQAEQLGAGAVRLGTINHWPTYKGDLSPEECARFDSRVLLYPGGSFGLNKPVQSVRLKHLRRSMQDLAYHVLLEQHGLEHVSRAIRSALAPYAGTGAYHAHFADGRAIGWPDDATLFDVARHIMARELLDSAFAAKYGGPPTRFNKDTLWRRLMLETRRFQVEVQGARIRLGASELERPVETEIILELFNNRRAPISGCLRTTALPTGWSETGTRACFGEIQAGDVKPFRLKLAADSVPIGTDGHIVVPLEIETDQGETIAMDALTSCVTANRLDHSITIDGDLADWSVGSSQVAGNFRLITAGTDPSGLGGRQPTSRTVGFVARDDLSLFIGITCEAGGTDRAPTMRRKAVTYEDMIPMREELIEVLIDPHNAGSRSPEDLFHIVVKRSGIDVTEQGVHFQPPCGRTKPWPVAVEVATRVKPGQWSVEIRIPLSAFGVGEMTPTIWGFNITRFDVGMKEFSTWAGAVRNAYDPASLGNLYLP